MSVRMYRIGEAAALLGLKSYVLRFWETEFSQLEPVRTERGQRLYTEEHIDLLRLIRHLLHERGLTIDGARRILNSPDSQKMLRGGDFSAVSGFSSEFAEADADLEDEFDDHDPANGANIFAPAFQAFLDELIDELEEVRALLAAQCAGALSDPCGVKAETKAEEQADMTAAAAGSEPGVAPEAEEEAGIAVFSVDAVMNNNEESVKETTAFPPAAREGGEHGGPAESFDNGGGSEADGAAAAVPAGPEAGAEAACSGAWGEGAPTAHAAQVAPDCSEALAEGSADAAFRPGAEAGFSAPAAALLSEEGQPAAEAAPAAADSVATEVSELQSEEELAVIERAVPAPEEFTRAEAAVFAPRPEDGRQEEALFSGGNDEFYAAAPLQSGGSGQPATGEAPEASDDEAVNPAPAADQGGAGLPGVGDSLSSGAAPVFDASSGFAAPGNPDVPVNFTPVAPVASSDSFDAADISDAPAGVSAPAHAVEGLIADEAEGEINEAVPAPVAPRSRPVPAHVVPTFVSTLNIAEGAAPGGGGISAAADTHPAELASVDETARGIDPVQALLEQLNREIGSNADWYGGQAAQASPAEAPSNEAGAALAGAYPAASDFDSDEPVLSGASAHEEPASVSPDASAAEVQAAPEAAGENMETPLAALSDNFSRDHREDDAGAGAGLPAEPAPAAEPSFSAPADGPGQEGRDYDPQFEFLFKALTDQD